MKKRALQITIVRNKKDQPPSTTEAEITLEGKAELISHYIDKYAAKVGKAVIAYVVADTLRKVIVAQAINK